MHVSAIVGVALALAHGVGVAQPKPAMPRVGYLSPASSSDPRIAPFRQGLADLGWVEGRTIAIEYRWAEERYERLPGLAAELIRLNVDVIVAWGPAIQAARHATGSIPIVMASTIDAVGSGFVASLAHPGGNVTGLTLTSSELMGKRLDLSSSAFPGSRVSRCSRGLPAPGRPC
jgi:putative ABC transport system substrate-binding protein